MKSRKLSPKRPKRSAMRLARKDAMPKLMKWLESWKTHFTISHGTAKITIILILLITIQNTTILIESLWMLWLLRELLTEFKLFKLKLLDQVTSNGKMSLTLRTEMDLTLIQLFWDLLKKNSVLTQMRQFQKTPTWTSEKLLKQQLINSQPKKDKKKDTLKLRASIFISTNTTTEVSSPITTEYEIDLQI